jgi:phospholipid/cholesterol/gamma-HCH transport system ATP-binding protein
MTASNDIAIEVKNLKAGYDGKISLQKINFQVRRGEVFVILGGSGCGNSTLLKHMFGMYPPLEGDVWFGPENIVTAEGEDRVRLLRQFGVMYQSGALFGSMSVLENVRLPLDEFTELPRVAKDIVALAKLKMVSLESAANKMPADLSGGMQNGRPLPERWRWIPNPLPGRALGRSGPDHVGRLGCIDPRAFPGSWHYLRRGDA